MMIQISLVGLAFKKSLEKHIVPYEIRFSRPQKNAIYRQAHVIFSFILNSPIASAAHKRCKLKRQKRYLCIRYIKRRTSNVI